MISTSKIKFFMLVLLLGVSQLSAANWLMLQGMEPEFVSPEGEIIPNRNRTPKVWGYIQTNYKVDYGKVAINSSGKNTTAFSLLNPDLKDQSGFNIAHARIALRGMADKENKVDYFLMTDFGNNAINNLAGHSNVATYLTDASVTLKYVPGAKLRVGKFKYPGSEEGLQAVFVSPYIEFTDITNQQLLERFVTNVGVAQTGSAAGGASTTHYTSSSIEDPVGAFRDTGVQLFDTFDLTDTWSLSYAYMYGNGQGVSNSSSDDQKTNYGYLALEDAFGVGKGYFTESVKVYLWGQTGKRTLLLNNGTDVTLISADRKRYGLGMTYYRHGLRFEAEYMKAEGMIFVGAKDSSTDALKENWQFQFATGTENKADGGYINLQYELFPKKFEIFGRYAILNRLTNDTKGERDFKTATLGASYRFKGATRIDFNYLIREAKAPGNSSAQDVLDNMGNRAEIQITAAF